MTDIPFITIIVPVYNNPDGIAGLIPTLLKQKYPGRYEIIVIDNNSSDDTKSVIKKYPVLMENASIRGSYSARNVGLQLAKGNLIAFTDSDCIAHPMWLKNGIIPFNRPKTDAAAGRIEFIFENNKPNIYEYLDSVRKLDQKSYVTQGFAATANLFVRKNTFQKYGLFRSDLLSGGDYEFGTRFTSLGGVLDYAPEAIVYHPARKNLREIYKKTKRLARGQKKLEYLGLLKHNSLHPFMFLPAISVPGNEYYSKFSFLQKAQLLALINLLKYTNIAYRIF